MKKKNIIILCVISVLIITGIIVWKLNNSKGESSEETLLYKGDNGKKIVVSVAVQEGEMLAYLGKVKVLDSTPNVCQVIEAINASDTGIEINTDENRNIIGLDDKKEECKVSINNKETKEKDTGKIEIENNDGITIYFESN